MQWKTGQPIMFTDGRTKTNEKFEDSVEQSWVQDVLHLRGLLKKEYELLYDTPPSIDAIKMSRLDMMNKIDVMHKWAEAKYTSQKLQELRKKTDIFYVFQNDGSILITEMGNKRAATIVV